MPVSIVSHWEREWGDWGGVLRGSGTNSKQYCCRRFHVLLSVMAHCRPGYFC